MSAHPTRTDERATETPAPTDATVTVVIPAYNERDGIGPTVTEVRRVLEASGHAFEVLVVDDGSTDGTGQAASAAGAVVVRLAENRGYGDALKTGIVRSHGDLVVIIDGDGTYPPDAIPALLDQASDADMVVGARSNRDVSVPHHRRPAKQLLTWLASYLAATRIPDLNSGLRVLKRSVLGQFMHLLPSGFSFTTTITLAMLCTGHRVVYVPVSCRPRVGSSKLRAAEFATFIMLVLRTVVLFNPLRVFLPLGAALFVIGLIKFAYDVTIWNLSETAVMAFLAAIVVWAVGLLADMIARLQLRPPPQP